MVFLCNINPIQLLAIEYILVLSFCCAKQTVLNYLLEKIDGVKVALTKSTVDTRLYLYVVSAFLLGVLSPYVFYVLLLLVLMLSVYYQVDKHFSQLETEYGELKTKIATARLQFNKQSVDFEREIEEEIITHANGEVQSDSVIPVNLTEPDMSSESKKSTKRHKRSSNSSSRRKSTDT